MTCSLTACGQIAAGYVPVRPVPSRPSYAAQCVDGCLLRAGDKGSGWRVPAAECSKQRARQAADCSVQEARDQDHQHGTRFKHCIKLCCHGDPKQLQLSVIMPRVSGKASAHSKAAYTGAAFAETVLRKVPVQRMWPRLCMLSTFTQGT